jgi:hypothetical protein
MGAAEIVKNVKLAQPARLMASLGSITLPSQTCCKLAVSVKVTNDG